MRMRKEGLNYNCIEKYDQQEEKENERRKTKKYSRKCLGLVKVVGTKEA